VLKGDEGHAPLVCSRRKAKDKEGMPLLVLPRRKEATRGACLSSTRVENEGTRDSPPSLFTSNLVKKRRGGVVTSPLVKLVSKNKRKMKKCGAPLAPALFVLKHVETDREVSTPPRLAI